METSLRYTCNSKCMKIHAKEKVPVNSKTHLQVKTLFSSPSYSTLALFSFLGSFFNFELNNAQKSLGICKV